MKHDWVSEGAKGGRERHWCKNCSWKREQHKTEVWYRRLTGQFVKRHWLIRWCSAATPVEQWSNPEPECDGEK